MKANKQQRRPRKRVSRSVIYNRGHQRGVRKGKAQRKTRWFW